MISLNFVANSVGILSLTTSVAVLYPTLIKIFKINLNCRRSILCIFRYGLLLTISLGLIHGLLMTQNTNTNFYDLSTYWTYASGLFVFNLFVFLAFVPELRFNFNKIDYLNYAALILLACHVGQKIAL